MSLKRFRFLKAFKHFRRIPEIASAMRHSPDWRKIILPYLSLAPGKYPMLLRNSAGSTMEMQDLNDLITYWGVFFRPEYRVPTDAVTVIDAGANIGTFSVYAAGRATNATVIALEPFPATFAQLEANVKRNPFHDRIHLRQQALSATDGTASMPSEDMPSQYQTIRVRGESHAPRIPVTSVSLATLFENEQIEEVDFLKIDIEGSEYDVIESSSVATLRRSKVIAMEYHRTGSKSALFGKLQEAGFILESDVISVPGEGVAHFKRQ